MKGEAMAGEIDGGKWKETQERHRQWWRREGVIITRWTPFVSAPPPPPDPGDTVEARWLDIERVSARIAREAPCTGYPADMAPMANFVGWGPGCLATYLGSRPKFAEDTVWFFPREDDPELWPEFRFDPENEWWCLHEATLGRLVRESEGRYLVGCPDLVENLDILCSLRDSQEIMMDMIEKPEWVSERIRQINAVWFAAYGRIFDIIKAGDGSSAYHAFGIWGDGKTAKLQCDASAMISEDMFDEFVVPALYEQLEMFIDRWAKPYSKYCEENHLAWTGHYWEHGWPKPTDGMDEAAFYIYHQQPGVDMLGNTYTPGGLGGQFGNTRALRELHSAANQGGHNRTLSETYGGAGWEINFANLKRLVDWEVVLGVNFVNQHLSYFTMKGVRKFDYPPSFSYHEPWWDNYKPMGDYIGRISMAMSSGEQINRTVVLQPNTTAWSYFSRKVQNATIDTIQNDFKRFIYQLERAHFEYDLGSEFVLHTIGSVNKGQMIIGKRSYNLVVIPATMENIEQGTYKLLKDYLLQGGRILSFTKNLPRVDGVDSKMVSELMTSFSKQWTFVATTGDDKVRSSMADPDFDITESLPVAGELYHQRRILKDGELLFFVNTDTAQTVSATITGNGKSLIQMDPATGKSVLVPVKSENGQITFDIELAPIGSAIYYLTKSNASALAAADIASSAPTAAENGAYIETTVSEKTETTVSQEADNVLVLDYVDLKGRKLDLKETHFMKAMHALFDSSGFKMGNPWQHKIQYKQDYMALDTFRTGSGFEVSYHFNVAANADLTSLSGIDIVAERPEIWDVYLNGEKLTKSDKWWIDREFFRFPAGNHLRAGANTITLKAGKMSVHAEIMPAYVVGRFKLSPLKKGFELTNGAIQTLGSWKTQGYPFYAQKVLYNQKYRTLQNGKSYKIKLNHWNGTMAVVWLNGEKAGMIMTPPYEFELPALKTGENTLGIEVIGSLKSTFGFFYKSAAGKWIIGPGDFDTAPPSLPSAGDYILPDYGLFEPFSLISLN